MTDQDLITQLESSCAAMREALDYCRDYVQHQPYGTLFKLAYVEKALSTDAGKSLLDRLQAVEAERDKLKDLLRWLKCTQHTQSPCDESGSHYSDLCEVCQRIEKALQPAKDQQ